MKWTEHKSKKLNAREQAIKQGYLDCIAGKQKALALRDNGKWTPTKSPSKCYKIKFATPDGLGYCGHPVLIEKAFIK